MIVIIVLIDNNGATSDKYIVISAYKGIWYSLILVFALIWHARGSIAKKNNRGESGSSSLFLCSLKQWVMEAFIEIRAPGLAKIVLIPFQNEVWGRKAWARLNNSPVFSEKDLFLKIKVCPHALNFLCAFFN